MNNELEIGAFFIPRRENVGYVLLTVRDWSRTVLARLGADGVWCFWLFVGLTLRGDPAWRSITRAQYEALALRGEEP